MLALDCICSWLLRPSSILNCVLFSLFISPQPSDACIHTTIADLSYELANSTLSSVAHNYAKPPLDVSSHGSGCFLFLVAHRIRPFCGKMRTNLRKLLVVPRVLAQDHSRATGAGSTLGWRGLFSVAVIAAVHCHAHLPIFPKSLCGPGCYESSSVIPQVLGWACRAQNHM